MLRVVFMGNPDLALPTIKLIQSSNHRIVGVVSNNLKPLGRGRKLQKTAVGEYAEEQNLKLIMPKSLNDENFLVSIKKLRPDIFVIVAYKILPARIIKIPKYGAINLHASLLPKYRGAAPIQWALMNGDKKTGVTIFQISKQVDTGDILLRKEMEIKPQDDYLSLGRRLCEMGSEMVVDALNRINNNQIKAIPQDSLLATSAPKISKDMLLINWTWSAKKIHNWIRGLSPYPGMYTIIRNKRLRIFRSEIKNKRLKSKPGTIIDCSSDFLIATGKGAISILDLQIEGKTKMSAKLFLRGFNLCEGHLVGK